MKKETIGMFGGKFLIVHKGHVHVHAMRKAAAMVDKLYVIVTYNVMFEREVYFHNSKVAPIAVEQRLRWWHEITKELDNVHVYAIEETNINKNADTHIDADTNAYAQAQAQAQVKFKIKVVGVGPHRPETR